MRIPNRIGVLAVALTLVTAVPSFAQRVAFERSYTVGATPTLDVTTIRGKIDVSVGAADRIVIRGTATVRLGLSSPTEAYELVKKVAAAPPIQQEGDTLRLRPPSSPEEQRAMTVAYDVTVPRGTIVRSNSDSGETTIAGVSGRVTIRTESAAISVRDLGGETEVTTQSGAVDADSVAGNLTVSTQSSRISARNLGAGLRVRTQSGAVEGTFRGQGTVDIGTGSSAIDLVGVNGALTASSNSGRIRVSGLPSAPWQVTSGSGSFELDFDSNAKLTLDARSGSGSVRVDGSTLQGSTSKGSASGTVGGGGPLVRANSRSGSIRIGLR
jgi:putative adhesin